MYEEDQKRRHSAVMCHTVTQIGYSSFHKLVSRNGLHAELKRRR